MISFWTNKNWLKKEMKPLFPWQYDKKHSINLVQFSNSTNRISFQKSILKITASDCFCKHTKSNSFFKRPAIGGFVFNYCSRSWIELYCCTMKVHFQWYCRVQSASTFTNLCTQYCSMPGFSIGSWMGSLYFCSIHNCIFQSPIIGAM